MSAANREKLFIFHYNNDIAGLVWRQITKIRHYSGDKSIHVALYLEVDATAIFQGCNIIISHNNIVGGASPNHCLEIGEKSKEEMVKLLKFCVDRNNGVVTTEVKVSVVLFQKKQ